MLPVHELQYLAKVLKNNAAEWQDKKKLELLHHQCSYTCKSLVREMVEGAVPICLQIDQYKPDERKDMIRFIHRCEKLYQIKDEVYKILMLIVKLEYDPKKH